jgi:hypothetical protein
MDVSGKYNAPAALTPGKTAGTHGIEVCVGGGGPRETTLLNFRGFELRIVQSVA